MNALIAFITIVLLFNLAAIIRIHLEVRALKRYTHSVVVNDHEAFRVAVDEVERIEREKRRDLQIKMNDDYRKAALDNLANIADSEGFKPEDRIVAASRLIHIVSPVKGVIDIHSRNAYNGK